MHNNNDNNIFIFYLKAVKPSGSNGIRAGFEVTYPSGEKFLVAGIPIQCRFDMTQDGNAGLKLSSVISTVLSGRWLECYLKIE